MSEFNRAVVKGKLGTYTFIPTDANHIYVTTDPDGGATKNGMVIRGIAYRASAHVYRYPDGLWRVGSPTAHEYQRPREAYLSFVEHRRTDPSPAARRTFIEEVDRLVNVWVGTHAQSLSRAELDAKMQQLNRLRGDARELREKLDAKLGDIARLVAELSALRD